jgi:hypothetical protein
MMTSIFIIAYRSTVGITFLSVTFIAVKSIPGVYRSAIAIPNIMLINVMACRVYRNTKFGIFRETTCDFVLPMEEPDIFIEFSGDNSSAAESTQARGSTSGDVGSRDIRD